MTFSPTATEFHSLASDHQYQSDIIIQAMNAEYLKGSLDGLGSHPTPIPYDQRTEAYEDGLRDARIEWLESCL